MNQLLQIQKGVPKPDNLPTRGGGDAKYSPYLSKMEVGDFLEIPKDWFFADGEEFSEEKYDPKKHRVRVNNAVRGWALKQNKAASEREGYDASTFKPTRFTVATLENGNVGIWRD